MRQKVGRLFLVDVHKFPFIMPRVIDMHSSHFSSYWACLTGFEYSQEACQCWELLGRIRLLSNMDTASSNCTDTAGNPLRQRLRCNPVSLSFWIRPQRIIQNHRSQHSSHDIQEAVRLYVTSVSTSTLEAFNNAQILGLAGQNATAEYDVGLLSLS